MPGPAATALQTGNPSMSTVSRQPQTTAPPPTGNAPFVRLSRKAFNRGYALAGSAFGALVNNPIKPVGGWTRNLLLTVTASGGSGSTTVAAQPDAPWSAIQTLLLRDPLGQPILNIDGFGLFEINKYSGQAGQDRFTSDPSQLPSFSNVATGASASGNFVFKEILPFELDSSGYCSLSSLNAAANIQMDIQYAASSAVYSTAPTNLPTITTLVEQAFWAAPVQNPQLGPPDPGASAQWTKAGGQTTVPSATNTLIASPRKGTWIHTLILVLRDSTGARVDGWPLTDLTYQIDGVPVIIEQFSDRVDEMFRFSGGVARDTGVIAYTFRDSVQQQISKADTHDLTQPTTPATLLEVGGTFQTITNAPGAIQFFTGELFPTNNAKIPWSHLAQ